MNPNSTQTAPAPLADRYRAFILRNNLPLDTHGELQAAIMEYLMRHPEPASQVGPKEYK